jgi:hypothetical protein
MDCPGRFVTDADCIGIWDPNHHQKEFHVIALTQVLHQIGLSTLIEGEI